MHAFADGAKPPRTWEVKITVSSIRRVRELTEVDLAGLLDEKSQPLMTLLGNPEKIAQVLYVLCQPQCEKLNVTPEDFGDALYGDPLEAAGQALMAELCFFIPNPRLREQTKKVFATGKEAAELILDEQDARIQKLDPQVLATAFIASRTRPAESSDSTQALTASEN